jgi:hypothetical protein
VCPKLLKTFDHLQMRFSDYFLKFLEAFLSFLGTFLELLISLPEQLPDLVKCFFCVFFLIVTFLLLRAVWKENRQQMPAFLSSNLPARPIGLLQKINWVASEDKL